MSLKISIITICFNNLPELLNTCKSVDMQVTAPFEHWIIDGSTNDEIKNYLSNHPQPAYRKWLNERDNGISDAFNKGVLRATGDVVNMLNSGDTYFDENVLQAVSKIFEQDSSVRWMHSRYEFKRSNEWIILGKPFDAKKLYRGMRSICHQSVFVKKALHDKYGLYDTSLKLAMDYDFICRIALERFYFSNEILIRMEPEGASTVNYLKGLEEIRQTYIKHFGNSFKLSIWQLRLKFLYYLLNTGIGKILFKIKKGLGLADA